MTAAATMTAAAAMAATAAAAACQLHAMGEIFLVEEIERGEAHVGHFLFAKNQALAG
jgi:hypothetical protein